LLSSSFDTDANKSSVVWALDLDNKDGEAAQYLSADTSSTGLDMIQRKKLSADKKQAYVGQMAYWTPCMSEDERTQTGCPGGKVH
jgi:chitinase